MNNEAATPIKKPAAGLMLTASAFIAFFIFGFSDVLKGSVIPEILSGTGISYNAAGALTGFTYFGFFAGTLSSVQLLKTREAPELMAAAVIIATSGLLLFSVAGQVVLMFISAFLIGAGGGLIDVAANLTVRLIAKSGQLGRRLNQLAFFHGAGAVLSPLFAGAVLIISTDWHSIYLFAGILTAGLSILALVFIARTRKNIPQKKYHDDERVVLRPSAALLGVILFFYMTLEAGISGWLVEYGLNSAELGTRKALLSLSLFFILLTGGRLLSSLYVDRLGLPGSVLLNFIAVLILVSTGVLFKPLFFLLPVSGLFMAPIFPTVVAMISKELGGANIRIMGLFFSVAGVGGIFGPWMIGMLSKNFSLEAGFSLLTVFTLCGLLVCGIYRKHSRTAP